LSEIAEQNRFDTNSESTSKKIESSHGSCATVWAVLDWQLSTSLMSIPETTSAEGFEGFSFGCE